MAGQRTIRKAIIPVAGLDTRLAPASLATPKAMFPVVCPDGRARPVLHAICRSAVAGGIEQIGLVVSPGREAIFRSYFRDRRAAPPPGVDAADLADLADLAARITIIEQERPEGLGAAGACAADFAAGEPVLVMLGDHLYLPGAGPVGPVGQVLGCFERLEAASVVGVAPVPAAKTRFHGVIAGEPAGDEGRLFRIRRIIEKPSAAEAAEALATPGLKADHYLAHAGLYAFGPEIFDVLARLKADNAYIDGEIQLTTAQQRLLAGGKANYALMIDGQALDMGCPAALAAAQAALWAYASRG